MVTKDDKSHNLEQSLSVDYTQPQKILRNLALFLIFVIVAVSVWYLIRPSPLIVQGVVDSERIDVSARVIGRMAAPLVERGQVVHAKSEIIRIDSQEIVAALATAKAAQSVAEANLARIMAGTRSETIAQLKSAMESAQENNDLAQKTYDRIKKLADKGFSPQSSLDQATDTLIVSTHTLEQAKLAYSQAVTGFTKEDIKIAQANVAKAKADVEFAQVQVNEMSILAPIDGQIFRINIEHGEFILPGVPLLSISDIDNPYIVINLREDLMSGLKIGQVLRFVVPALKREIEAKVYFISDRGEYSGWSSTRTTGDFDLRTFEVRLRPTDKIEQLRPGMSAYVQWKGSQSW